MNDKLLKIGYNQFIIFGKFMGEQMAGISTEQGFVNKNQQRNNGRTELPGTDNQQWFYEMECLGCGHQYYANGSDIWQRKCPKCQNGRP